jgi:hypothetical protein
MRLYAPVPDDSSTECAELLSWCGWSHRVLAERLSITEATARSWAVGRRPCPPHVLAWLRQIAEAIAACPALPEGWGRS